MNEPRILALDPGPVKTGAAVFCNCNREFNIHSAEVVDNTLLVDWVKQYALDNLGPRIDLLASERFQYYGPGKPIGKQVLESAFWLGQFVRTWNIYRNSSTIRLVENTKIRMHFCGTVACGEPQIRKALAIRLGQKPPAAHAMSALAVAIYVADQERVYGSRWYQGAA